MTIQWSRYQEDVFKFATEGSGHGAVDSVAGSGKTTTGVEMVQRFSPMEQGLYTSFTRSIVEATDKQLNAKGIRHARAKTYNSFGYEIVRKYLPSAKLLPQNDEKTDTILKYDILHNEEGNRGLYFRVRNAVFRMVNLFKSLAILSVDEAAAQMSDIVDYYDVELPKEYAFKSILLETYAQSLRRTDILDFNDQKLFPVLFDWEVPQVDFLVIDEYQDTCPVESALMLRTCRYGRIIIFGDPYQAIYSFKGTKPDSMATFITEQTATRLPLSISYRCPKTVVAEAQKIVPHIEAAPDAIEGVVDVRKTAEFLMKCTPRDMVLARCTQDLVRNVIRFLQGGIPAYVEGREYGTQLKWFIEKHLDSSESELSSEALMNRIYASFNEIHPELLKHNREAAALALETKLECVEALVIGCKTAFMLKQRIDQIFADQGRGIRHMTIHKSKGLQGEKDGDVWILRPDKLPHPRAKKPHLQEEERRLKYVAITRTRRGLFSVQPEENER